MILPRSVVNEYGKEQARVMKAAKAELLRVAGMLDWTGGPEEMMLNREAMVSVTADIVARYGMAAAANAAELFEAMDEAFTGAYKIASLDTELTYQAVSAAVHFAAGSLFPGDDMPPDVDAFLSRLSNSVIRMVNKQAMDTMAANQREGIKYRRVTSGDNVCQLCAEWDELGYVWEIGDMVEPHDGCMCSLVPGFGDDPDIVDTGEVYEDLKDIF